MNRRELLGRSAAMVAGSTFMGGATGQVLGQTYGTAGNQRTWGLNPKRNGMPDIARKMKLGLVTYNLARDWNLDTIIARCKEVGIEAVEFRSTHKHGVEPTLTKPQRRDVKKRCADGGLIIWGVGSACEYHSPDPAVVARNIEETKAFAELAADIGARGVKVRPNSLPKEVSEEKTMEQIGRSLRTVGEAASSMGVEIWCEMHGRGTAHPQRMRKLMDLADHASVGVTWNSNRGIDDEKGSIKEYFELLRPKIYSVHINELVNGYPYRELFALLNETGYDRYTMIEAQGLRSGNVDDTVRFMKFYRALWEELSTPSELSG